MGLLLNVSKAEAGALPYASKRAAGLSQKIPSGNNLKALLANPAGPHAAKVKQLKTMGSNRAVGASVPASRVRAGTATSAQRLYRSKRIPSRTAPVPRLRRSSSMSDVGRRYQAPRLSPKQAEDALQQAQHAHIRNMVGAGSQRRQAYQMQLGSDTAEKLMDSRLATARATVNEQALQRAHLEELGNIQRATKPSKEGAAFEKRMRQEIADQNQKVNPRKLAEAQDTVRQSDRSKLSQHAAHHERKVPIQTNRIETLTEARKIELSRQVDAHVNKSVQAAKGAKRASELAPTAKTATPEQALRKQLQFENSAASPLAKRKASSATAQAKPAQTSPLVRDAAGRVKQPKSSPLATPSSPSATLETFNPSLL